MTQNVTKNRMDFLVQEQLITNKTEAIMRGMIQDTNRELPFYLVSFKFVYMTSGINKNIFNYKQQILYTQPNTLLEVIYKQLSHMPTHV